MGIFDALTTAVGGLQGQSFALQNISGNIANSQTTGFKETDTSFDALVEAAAAGQQTSGSVIANSVATNSVQGSIQSSSVPTNLAINGEGYFVVSQPTSFSDNEPVFSGVNDYTRNGSFQENDNGNLVNNAGYYLMGIPVSATTGNPLGSVPQVLQFNNNFVPAQATSQLQYTGNLPSSPTTTDTVANVAGSDLLNPDGFTADPLVGAPAEADIIGTGASLAQDAQAVGTGTVLTLPSGGSTTLGQLGLTGSQTLTVGDGTNTTSLTVTTGETISALATAITSAAGATPPGAQVSAALNSSNQLVITSTGTPSATDTITLGGTGNADSVIGFGVGNDSFQPVNLITQGAVSSGQTLTVTTQTPPGAPTTTTVTFGTNFASSPPQVATLAQLNAALGALGNVTASVNPANGDIKISANNTTDQVTVGGTASAAKFGITNLLAIPANGTVIADDAQTFDNESISGGSVTTFDSTGNPINVQLRWAKTSSAATGGTDTWQLFYQTNSSATGTEAEWQNVGQTFTFNSSGDLSPPISSFTIPGLTVNGDTLGSVQFVLGSNGLTQFADSSGAAQVNQFTQNGFAAGQLESIAIDNENRIVGTFTNGQTIPLAQVTLATFNGQDSLQPINGGAYQATADSGPPLYDGSGSIVGNSLEASNVDIATQFSQLIVAQQAYSANAKVMTTADQMIQSLLQVIQ